jgi:hypothetical protein
LGFSDRLLWTRRLNFGLFHERKQILEQFSNYRLYNEDIIPTEPNMSDSTVLLTIISVKELRAKLQ